jgi:hypothetical protein
MVDVAFKGALISGGFPVEIKGKDALTLNGAKTSWRNYRKWRNTLIFDIHRTFAMLTTYEVR